jgi:hypothetical protein
MAKRGPKTDAGRAAVGLNALKHGICSATPVIAGLESEEEWEAHLQGVIASLAPEGHLEAEFSERIAQLLWRLRRVVAYERYAIELGQERIAEDIVRIQFRFGSRSRVPLRRFEDPDSLHDPAEVTKRMGLAAEALRLLKGCRSLADDVLLDEAEAGVITDAIFAVIGPNSGAYEFGDWPEAWTVGDVWQMLAVIGEVWEVDTDAVLDAVIVEILEQVRWLEVRARELSTDISRMARERILPSEQDLNKVMRHEAHLERQLTRAMHELEALQARRLGCPAPLARLDINSSVDGENVARRLVQPGD